MDLIRKSLVFKKIYFEMCLQIQQFRMYLLQHKEKVPFHIDH